MDKRRSKLLILAFAIIFFCVGSLFLNYQSFFAEIKIDRDYVIGQLMEKSQLTESQIMEVITHDINEESLETGQELAAKYGLSDNLTDQQELIQNFSRQNGFILVVSFFLLGGLILGSFFTNRKRETEMKLQLEEQAKNQELASLQLQRKVKEADNIKASITDIAHQLKTPVASLRLSVEIALSDDYSTAERQEFKAQTEIQVNKLDVMLDGLVKISQMEADLIRLQPKAYSLKKIAEEVINSLIMKALEKEIEIELEQVSDDEVLIDRKWTREALGNVLENAIKYSPANTTIVIRLTRLVTYALIEIIDEGPGIPKEEINLIYQRFYRGQQAELTDYEGSGVGLYLARKIIEEQGGVINVQARKPQGSNFQLTLPLSS